MSNKAHFRLFQICALRKTGPLDFHVVIAYPSGMFIYKEINIRSDWVESRKAAKSGVLPSHREAP